MAYEPHTWKDKELITAEKLNNLEEGANAKSIPGPPGPKGFPGDPGKGLIGEPAALSQLADGADSAAVLAKVKEIIGVLNARGISKEA